MSQIFQRPHLSTSKNVAECLPVQAQTPRDTGIKKTSLTHKELSGYGQDKREHRKSIIQCGYVCNSGRNKCFRSLEEEFQFPPTS